MCISGTFINSLNNRMPRFNIHHITKYTYEGPVRDSANQIVLFPIKDEYQEVLKQELTITGDPLVDVYKDYYENEVGSFTNAEPHILLIIDSVKDAFTLAAEVPEIRSINFGGIRGKQGSRMVSKAIALTEEDITLIRELLNKGIELEVRQVPTDSRLPVESLIK